MFAIYLFSKRFLSRNISKKCFENLPIYESNIKIEMEKYWKAKLQNICEKNHELEKYYVLSMFPYPSGNLHMGHMRVYTVADAIARYQRLCNKDVIFPMGWDSFGLPAENAAFERGLEPKEWTIKNIGEMKKQMKDQMTLSIDWSREISTCHPKYFKWTQWIFARLFEKGFAYQRSDVVNWDPVDRTVLADELIDTEGRSWRSGALVEKKRLKQWFLRTTSFTESLLAGLETVNDNEWRHVVDAQQGWLGKLEGSYVEFDLIDCHDGGKCIEQLAVFTTTPVAVLTDLIAYIEINQDNVWWEKFQDCNVKSQKYLEPHTRYVARHPLSGRLVPIIKNSNLKFNEEECLSSRFCIPFLNLHDAREASTLGVMPSKVHLGAYNRIKGSAWKPSEGHPLNEDLEISLNEEALETLQQMQRGGYRCSKLRTDWLISRQRYWGTPIPIAHCPDCGPVLIPDEKLPVELPNFELCQSANSCEASTSPLANISSWVDISCPKCGNVEAKRETDTMDTFVDSSWYYLRYLDPKNDAKLCSSQIVRDYMPVDIYIGGVEHAIRHLFYARFIAHFLHHHTDIKGLNGPEPFLKFLPIGLVLGRTYRTKLGQFVPVNEVKYQDNDKKAVHIATGEPLVEYWDKMSKSKNNGISPESVVLKYGLDSTRLILLANTGPDRSRKWQENDVVTGIINWEKRMFKLIKYGVEGGCKISDKLLAGDCLLEDSQFLDGYHHNMTEILACYNMNALSGVVAHLQKLTSHLLKTTATKDCQTSILFYRTLFDFLVLLHPMSPILSSELWAHLSESVSTQEGVFLTSEGLYLPLCGRWTHDLTRPIWEQTLTGLTEAGLRAARGATRIDSVAG